MPPSTLIFLASTLKAVVKKCLFMKRCCMIHRHHTVVGHMAMKYKQLYIGHLCVFGKILVRALLYSDCKNQDVAF